MFGHGDGIGIADGREWNAPLGQGGDIDVVVADAVAGDDLQAARLPDRLAVER